MNLTQTHSEGDELIRLAKRLGAQIRENLHKNEVNTDVYPSPNDTDLEKLEADILSH